MVIHQTKDSALLVVAEYMFARKTQYLSLQNTLKDKSFLDIPANVA